MKSWKLYSKQLEKAQKLLPLEEQARAVKLIQRLRLQEEQENSRDLASFARLAWNVLEPGTELKWNWHLDLLCEYLTLVRDRRIRRLIINVPPQTMKSRLVNVFYPCWSWTQIATRRFLSSSYSGDLSESFNVERSLLLRSEWFRDTFPNKVVLTKDSQKVVRNDVGGSMTATSTGGTATGKGSHDVIIDDPLNPKQAASDLELKSSNDFFDNTLRTRLSDQITGTFVVVMQRLDLNDLTGHLLEKNPGEWTHLSIPMEAEEDEKWTAPITGTVYERKKGDPLWVSRFPPTVIASLHRDMGSIAYGGQYQQRPTPKGGTIIKRHWFREFWDWTTLPKKFEQVIQSWDCSFGSKSDAASFVVGDKWAAVGAKRYLLWEKRDKMSYTETRDAMMNFPVGDLTTAFPAHAKYVENKANGPAVIDDLRHAISGLIAIEPDGDKVARMCAVSPFFEAGDIVLPNPEMPGFEWVRDWIEEICRFPMKPNDRGDCASQAIRRLSVFPSGLAEYYRNLAGQNAAQGVRA